MGGDEKNPIFHDFLGMSSDDNKAAEVEMEAEASAGLLSSEGPGADSSEVFHFHGRKNISLEPEGSNTISGRKRSISSSYMSLVRDRMLSLGSDSHEKSHVTKALGKEIVSEQLGKSHDVEIYSMQPPARPTSLLAHQSVSSRLDSLIPKWDHSLPMNSVPRVHFSSHLGQSRAHMEKISLPYTYKDVNSGATVIAHTAADEGSRTGMKSSGILNIINSSNSLVGEKNIAGPLPCSSRPRASQLLETESSNAPSHRGLTYPSQQMTIFYAGQAHVFDDVHPNKADVILALAGSSGVSWSTNCSPKPGAYPSASETKAPSGQNDLRVNNSPLSMPGVPDRGLIAQAAPVSHANDLQSPAPGSLQGGQGKVDDLCNGA